jgi:hypothetical protein
MVYITLFVFISVSLGKFAFQVKKTIDASSKLLDLRLKGAFIFDQLFRDIVIEPKPVPESYPPLPAGGNPSRFVYFYLKEKKLLRFYNSSVSLVASGVSFFSLKCLYDDKGVAYGVQVDYKLEGLKKDFSYKFRLRKNAKK